MTSVCKAAYAIEDEPMMFSRGSTPCARHRQPGDVLHLDAQSMIDRMCDAEET